MKKPTAIILAAGQGTRLRPLTDDKPKCMVEVSGKPILDWQLDTLTEAGIDDIIVVTGYREDKIQDLRITKVYNEYFASTNMVYSLFCAEEYLQGDVIVSYGDIIYSGKVLQQLINNDRDIVIASDEEWHTYWKMRCEDPLSDAESFKKGTNGKVKSLGQKADSVDDIEGQFIGLMKFSNDGCRILRSAYNQCLNKNNKYCNEINAWDSGRSLHNTYMTDIMNYFAQKKLLYYVSINRDWFEIDNDQDLKIANNNINSIL